MKRYTGSKKCSIPRFSPIRCSKTLFTTRRPHHVDHLTWFTADSFGGSDRFTRELGFRHIIDVHRHLKITDEQRVRFVARYMEAP